MRMCLALSFLVVGYLFFTVPAAHQTLPSLAKSPPVSGPWSDTTKASVIPTEAYNYLAFLYHRSTRCFFKSILALQPHTSDMPQTRARCAEPHCTKNILSVELTDC